MNRTTVVLIAATDTALTTVAAVRDALDDVTVSDAYLTRQIAAASSVIANECGRVFGRERVTDTFVATDNAPLILSRNQLTDQPGLIVSVAGATFALNAGAGLVSRTGGAPWCGTVDVTYTAGWTLPGQDAPTLPAAVEMVCIDRVTAAVFARGRDPAISRERAENIGDVAYFAASPGDIDPRLMPYRIFA